MTEGVAQYLFEAKRTPPYPALIDGQNSPHCIGRVRLKVKAITNMVLKLVYYNLYKHPALLTVSKHTLAFI